MMAGGDPQPTVVFMRKKVLRTRGFCSLVAGPSTPLISTFPTETIWKLVPDHMAG